mmetsp:Transcript_2874/g.4455  ORF Transcript_2874/g.4455 Transcript_2874/m.4455 type:complete len:108 (+) Transcript_2874:2-325(+)
MLIDLQSERVSPHSFTPVALSESVCESEFIARIKGLAVPSWTRTVYLACAGSPTSRRRMLPRDSGALCVALFGVDRQRIQDKATAECWRHLNDLVQRYLRVPTLCDW